MFTARSTILSVLLLGIAASPARAAFPGSNGELAFDCGDGTAICAAHPDGSSASGIVDGGSAPAWSADGSKVVYLSSQDGSLWVADADGSNARTLNHPGQAPTWSPDGLQIAFDDGAELLVMNADGTGAHTIASSPDAFYKHPTWSPDGTKIAAEVTICPGKTGPCDTTGSGVYTMAPDGSDRVRVAGTEVGDEEPDWSPDGTKLVFLRHESGTPAKRVAVVDAAGGAVGLVGPEGRNLAPAWAPDGNSIAWEHGDTIWVMDADGDNARELVAGINGDPSWQPIPPTTPTGGGGGGTDPGTGTGTGTGGGGRDTTTGGNDGTGTPTGPGQPGPTTGGEGPGAGPCANNIMGTAHRDLLTGTDSGDSIDAGGGADVVHGLGGDDCIAGGAGPDELDGGPGDDTIVGDPRDDRRPSAGEANHIVGGPGSDTIVSWIGADHIDVHDGEVDRVFCGPGHDHVFADRRDKVASNCESVRVGVPPVCRAKEVLVRINSSDTVEAPCDATDGDPIQVTPGKAEHGSLVARRTTGGRVRYEYAPDWAYMGRDSIHFVARDIDGPATGRLSIGVHMGLHTHEQDPLTVYLLALDRATRLAPAVSRSRAAHDAFEHEAAVARDAIDVFAGSCPPAARNAAQGLAVLTRRGVQAPLGASAPSPRVQAKLLQARNAILGEAPVAARTPGGEKWGAGAPLALHEIDVLTSRSAS
jgi:Tol biopolymer transport system component